MTQENPKIAPRTILIVDDEFAIRDFLYAYLKTKGFRVLTAESADEALVIWEAEKGNIDLLLTDMLMPGMDGHALSEKFKALKPELGVVFMSGYMPLHLSEVSLAHPFLKKPFPPHELLDAVRKSLK